MPLPQKPIVERPLLPLEKQRRTWVFTTSYSALEDGAGIALMKYIRLLWPVVVNYCKEKRFEGPVAWLVTKGLHRTSGEPKHATKHMTVRLFDRRNMYLATTHIPPKDNEELGLFEPESKGWNGQDFGKLYRREGWVCVEDIQL